MTPIISLCFNFQYNQYMLTTRPFSHLWSHLFPPQEQVAPQPLDLQTRLQDTLARLRAEAERLPRPADQGLATRHSLAEATFREQREQARRRLEEDILSLHGVLQSGLSQDELGELRQVLPTLWPAPDGAECRMEVHVLDGLFQRVGSLAWERLLELVGAAGLGWPVASELVHGRTGEALTVLIQQHQREVQAGFLAQTAQACADQIAGEVAAWSHGYPEEGSWLWRETALRAVGSALRARLFLRAVELWKARPPEVEQELQDLMRPHVEETQRLLSGGQLSPGQALDMLQQIERACQEAVPLKVWCYLRGALTERDDPECPCR